MGALSKKNDGEQSSTSILPSLFGGDDEFGIDDVLGLARRFF